MKPDYNETQLQSMLETFFTLTNANICVFDPDFHVIASLSDMPCFCAAIRRNERLFRSCMESDRLHAEECRHTRRSVTYTCHAGIVETISPIYLDDLLLGYVIFGGLRDEENALSSEQAVRRNCREQNLDTRVFIRHYKNLPSFTHRQLKAYIAILDLCIKNMLTEKMLKPDRTLFANQVLIYLQEHFTEHIGVNDLCARFGVTSKTLYRVVRDLTGKTINEFLTDLRVKEAKKLLLNSDLPVFEIAGRAGYDDYNYFIRLFKKKTGLSPLCFRKARESQPEQT